MSNPSVLVVGGCGSFGHTIIKQLIEDPEFSQSEIAVLDINTQKNRIDGVKYLKGSICSRDEVLHAIQEIQPQVVFHTVSPKHMVQANTRTIFSDVNIGGTTMLLDCIKEVGVTKAFIYSSTSSVIHNNMSDLVNATEDAPLCFEPEQPEYYTHTRAVAEQLVVAANKQDGLLTTIIRAVPLFGEGDKISTPQIVENARAGRGKFQIGNNTNLFDWVFTENLAYAQVLAAKALLRESTSAHAESEESKVNGEAFVITNDEPWPFWDFSRAIGAAAGYPVKKEEVRIVPASLYYGFAVISEWVVWMISLGRRESVVNRRMVKYLTMTRTFDISKAKKRLGYRPRVSMQEGIERTVECYVSRHPEEKNKVI